MLKIVDNLYFANPLWIPILSQICFKINLINSDLIGKKLLIEKIYKIFEIIFENIKNIRLENFKSLVIMKNFISLLKRIFNRLVLDQILTTYLKNKGNTWEYNNSRIHNFN